jgi:hypothetical protein
MFFPYIGNNHPNWRSHIFYRAVGIPPARYGYGSNSITISRGINIQHHPTILGYHLGTRVLTHSQYGFNGKIIHANGCSSKACLITRGYEKMPRMLVRWCFSTISRSDQEGNTLLFCAWCTINISWCCTYHVSSCSIRNLTFGVLVSFRTHPHTFRLIVDGSGSSCWVTCRSVIGDGPLFLVFGGRLVIGGRDYVPLFELITHFRSDG